MKSIEGILKLAENEFDAIVNNGKFRSREEIDSVYKLMDIVKECQKVVIRAGAKSVSAYVKINYRPEGDVLTIEKKVTKHHK